MSRKTAAPVMETYDVLDPSMTDVGTYGNKIVFVTDTNAIYTMVNPPEILDRTLIAIPHNRRFTPNSFYGHQVHEFMGTQWVTATCPYLPFMPVSMNFTDKSVLNSLRYSLQNVPVQEYGTGEFGISEAVVAEWTELENNLVQIIKGLKESATILYPLDYRSFHRPSRFFNCRAQSGGAARWKGIEAQSAFRVLISETTWHIARTLSIVSHGEDPTWVDIMKETGIDPSLLTALKTSVIGNIRYQSEPGTQPLRCGAFVDASTSQGWDDTIRVMSEVGITFCIYWGTRHTLYRPSRDDRIRRFYFSRNELKWASERQLSVKFMSPPVHPLSLKPKKPKTISTPQYPAETEPAQPPEATTSTVPSTTPLVVNSDAPEKPRFYENPGNNEPDPRQLVGETWREFLVRREETEAKRIAKESDTDKAARLQREVHARKFQVPGRKSASHVFQWVDGRRTYVNKNALEDVWEEYTTSQMRYSSAHNEWDLIEELSPDDHPNYDDDYDMSNDIPAVPAPLTHTLPIDPNTVRTTPLVSLEPTVHLTLDTLGLEQCLYQRFGFSPVLSSFSSDNLSDSERTTLHKVQGDLPLRSEVSPALGRAIIAGFQQPFKSLPPNLGDLHAGHEMFVGHLLRSDVATFSVSRRDDDYVLTWPAAQFTIITSDPCTVLQVLRAKKTSFKDVLGLLLSSGTAFKLDSPTLHSPEKKVYAEPGLGSREKDWKPKSSLEYEIYVSYRDFLFHHRPVLRSALMSGGLLWRLAVESAGVDILDPDVFLGDCEADGFDYQLTDGNVDIICGVYQVRVAHSTGSSISELAWFPKPTAWSKSALALGVWTRWAESWYSTRVTKALTQFDLMTQKSWKSRIALNRKCTELAKVMTADAKEALDRLL